MALERTSPWPFAGIGLLACMFFIYGGSLIYMHWWLVLVLYLVWFPVAIRASDSFAHAPARTFPIASLSVITYVVAVGVQTATR